MKKYFPIFVSKKGELVALQHLAQNVKDEICPIIEVLKGQLIIDEKKDEKTGKIIETKYPETLEKSLKTHWNFFGNQIILDFHLFNEMDKHISLVKNLFTNLINSGVNIIPAIQRNSNIIYTNWVLEMIKKYNCKICIRTSGNSGGFLDFNKQIHNILTQYQLSPNNVILLLDLGQVNNTNYGNMLSIAGNEIKSLSESIDKWDSVVVASSSFPEEINELIPGNVYEYDRYESNVWETLNEIEYLKGIKYGDYGTSTAIFADVNYAGSVSLKYTLKKKFLIYRGSKTKKHEHGHGQYIIHATQLVNTNNFYGRDFSWGDERLYEISREDVSDDKRKTGNATNWVQNSQNHHITLLHSLL